MIMKKKNSYISNLQDDFCRYVKKQHSLVFYGHKIGRSPNLSLKRQIANAVKVLEKAIFFQ